MKIEILNSKTQAKHTLHRLEKMNCFEVSTNAAIAETAYFD